VASLHPKSIAQRIIDSGVVSKTHGFTLGCGQKTHLVEEDLGPHDAGNRNGWARLLRCSGGLVGGDQRAGENSGCQERWSPWRLLQLAEPRATCGGQLSTPVAGGSLACWRPAHHDHQIRPRDRHKTFSKRAGWQVGQATAGGCLVDGHDIEITMQPAVLKAGVQERKLHTLNRRPAGQAHSIATSVHQGIGGQLAVHVHLVVEPMRQDRRAHSGFAKARGEICRDRGLAGPADRQPSD